MSRPPGPVAFLYARLSYDESRQQCKKCQNRWHHTRGIVARCPKCGWQTPYDSPVSIERQVSKLTAWCRAKWEPEQQPTLVVVEELCSGFKEFKNRPEAARIAANMQKGDYLLVTRLARGWRNSKDFHMTIDECEKKGVDVIVIEEQYDTSTAMGKFIISLSAALAQLERDYASERVKQFNEQCRKTGRVSGNHIPFGSMATICQQTGKKIVVDNPDELRMAKWVYEMKYEKKVDWHTIYACAKRLGFVSRAGRAYTVGFLRKIGMKCNALKAAGKI